MKRHGYYLFAAVVLLVAPPAVWIALKQIAPKGKPAHVELFSPEGTIKEVRQVTARFDQPMVTLGDPRLPDPFDIDCPVSGTGRWADTRNWVYDFEGDLEAGIRCRFTPKKGFSLVENTWLSNSVPYLFDTGGPAIVDSFPHEGWSAIDEEQIFLLKLDAPATQQSIEANAHCVVEGISEQIPVTVVMGKEREELLKARQFLGYDYFRILWKEGDESSIRVRNRSLEEAEKTIFALRCQRRLPPATQVRLVWGKGIATESGIATTQDQTLAYRVREAFTVSVNCSRTNARTGCIPMQPINVNFTAPVPREKALAIQLKTADGTLLKPDTSTVGESNTLQGVQFSGPFPEDSTVTVILPENLADDAGRPLENAARFPLEMRIDDYPALAKFSGDFGILEAKEGGILPVTIRNLETEVIARQASFPGKVMKIDSDPRKIADWLQRVKRAEEWRGEWIDDPSGKKDSNGRVEQIYRNDTGADSIFGKDDSTTPLTVATPGSKKPAEVIGIPLKEPGFYVVELESRLLGQALLGRDAPRYVATSALVTNMAVHFKWGREASQVWVTQLDTGNPVVEAEVAISNYCGGSLFWEGKTDKDGLAIIENSWGDPSSGDDCRYVDPVLFVSAKKGEDFSFTQSSWNQGIDPNDFSVQQGSSWNIHIFHTVLDRPLFRTGETVSMKHFIRQHEMKGIAVAPGLPRKEKITISHSGSDQTYEVEASFDANGIAENQWKIPEEAKLGNYTVDFGERNTAHFKVEQFRLPSMRASISGPVRPLVNPKQAELDLHVAYLSGGGATALPVKVRSMVEPLPLIMGAYPDYEFGGTSVKEGLETRPGSYFDYDFETGLSTGESTKTQVIPLTLDDNGAARVSISDLPKLEVPSQLSAELEYADANGEILTANTKVSLSPSALRVGIGREGWVASQDQLRFKVLVLDLDGKPKAQQAVTASLFQSKSYSYRNRLLGGFYAYETTTENKKLAANCTGKTNEQGLLLCDVQPGESGQILIRAEATDELGNLAGATASTWVVGKDDWWFGGTKGDRMDLIPEKKEYEAGDTARLQVRMPFRTAKALVTVEREGVMSSFVTHLDGHEPIVEVPIANNYAPNVFVSVLALRGRVERFEGKLPKGMDSEITAMVDLNKPAFRLGMAEIKVGWKPHRLNVEVIPEQKVYKVRDKAKVKIHVTRATGEKLPEGTEIAIAAVDEALLELSPNPTWNLLEAMMGERGLEVLTSTAQMQVVGKRHYGRKAVLHGGGGGRGAREKFDSLLFWQGRAKLDAQGNAEATIPLNDSLSSFRIVAIANGGEQLFGTGSNTIATSQDLILVSGLPPLVREGDSYSATFTLRNTSNRNIVSDIVASVVPVPVTALSAQHVEIPPGQSRDLIWKITAPINATQLQWEVKAQEANGSAGDKLKITQKVIPAYPVRTYQATIAQLKEPLSMPAQRPAGAVPGRGGLEITLREKLGDGLDGVKEYMKLYPYICLEQNLSKAVVLRSRDEWDAWMTRLPAYMDQDGLLTYFGSNRPDDGDDTLTTYVLAIADEADWPISESQRKRMVEGLTSFVKGKIVRYSALPTADLTIRKLAAIEALSRYDAATPDMLDSITIEPNLWPTSAVIDWIGILNRVKEIPQTEERLRTAVGDLRARLNFQGTIMTFSTERTDALWWLMISSDSNANRMLLTTLNLPEWREDIPRLVRGALGRQQFGHWNTTVANAWGVLAMEKFSAAFESVAITDNTVIQYAKEEKKVDWNSSEISVDNEKIEKVEEVKKAQDSETEQNQTSEKIHKQGKTRQINLPWAESKDNVSITHQGTGAPWAMVRATAALPLDKPLSSGYKILRTITPVEQQVKDHWTRGDVMRVKLELEAQSDMSWVVVDDPIPAGSTVLGSGLGGQSQLLTRGEQKSQRIWDGAWLAFEERRFDAFRSYYRFVPKGKWTVEYTLRLNNPGIFQLPATRVEAMYAPEMFGEIPNAVFTVEPTP